MSPCCECTRVRPEVVLFPDARSGNETRPKNIMLTDFVNYGKFSSLKIFRRWPTTTKIRCTKIFQCQSDKVRIALLGYMKPVRGLPDHCGLFFFSYVTNSI